MASTRPVLACLFAVLLGVVDAPPAAALSGQQELIDKSRITFDKLITHEEFTELPNYVRQAKALLIFPSLIKGGFIVGGEGGTGVLLVRGEDGSWSPPAFYRMWSGSFGLQAGVQNSEVIIMIMSQKGIDAVLDRQTKLGADASIAAGPQGAGAEAATGVGFSADMYSYSQTSGVYAGLSLEGSFLEARSEWNKLFYARELHSRDIVLGRKVTNESAVPLMRALERR